MANGLEGPVQITTPIRFSDPLPDSVDVVVIGGGVVGIFSALYMARTGLTVLVCEKGRIACEQSSRNWGWIRQYGRDRDELPIMMEASRLWEQANKETKGRTGFSRTGVCHIASTDKTLEKRESWLEIAREHQLDTRMISAGELGSLIDQGNGAKTAHKWTGAAYTESDARAEPWQAIPAIAELAQHEGVRIIENCAVRNLEVTNRSVSGVHTESGYVSCDQALLCAGAWSSLFARNQGINIPQLSVRSTACKTAPMPEVFSGCAIDENLAFRRREDGGYNLAGGGNHDLYIGPDSFRHFFKYLPVAFKHLPDTTFKVSAPPGFPDSWSMKRKWQSDEVSPFEGTRVLNPPPNLKRVEIIRQNFAKRFPDLGKPTIQHAWAGLIDAMPDIVPIVDCVASVSGLMMATGMSGHGFGIGPGFGKIIAEIANGRQSAHDISRFRFSRFSDGSKLHPGPAI